MVAVNYTHVFSYLTIFPDCEWEVVSIAMPLSNLPGEILQAFTLKAKGPSVSIKAALATMEI